MKPIEILLVEDNPGDVLLTKEAFKDAKLLNNLHVATDGEEAIDFLLQRGKFSEAKRPELILLDLNLPKLDGQQVLEKIKTDEELKRIPVVMLTSSEAEKDIVNSYNLHANSYIVKPLDLNQFSAIIAKLENFWFTVVTLPKK